MIIAMQQGATEEQIQHVIERLVNLGFEVHRSTGAVQTVLGAVGVRPDFDVREIEVLDGVKDAHRITSPYKLVGRSFRPEGTEIRFSNGVIIGGKNIVLMAGPWSVETRDQLFTVAQSVGKTGAKGLRGGGLKTRPPPDSYYQETLSFADDCRSVAWHRTARQSCAHGPSSGSRRLRRIVDRGPSRSGKSIVRWRPVALP